MKALTNNRSTHRIEAVGQDRVTAAASPRSSWSPPADVTSRKTRDKSAQRTLVESGRPRSFTGDGNLFRLVSEALRIQLASLFHPVLAVHSSLVEPLPHQITAVYEETLTRQPLRLLLADDTCAGKTIMAGLRIKELIVRGDLKRCMIVAPGNLVEQ